MASTLRTWVSPTSIQFAHNNYEGRGQWGIIEFNGEHGTSGNTGVKLQDAFYKVKHNYAQGTPPHEYTFDYECSWTKEHDYPKGEDVWGDFYPIIGTAMTPDATYSAEEEWPLFHEVGEQVWWGSTFYAGRSENPTSGDTVRGRLVNYVAEIKLNSSDGFLAHDTYGPLYQGFDSENIFSRWPNDSVERTGWSDVAIQAYAPQYDVLFKQFLCGNGNLCLPWQIYNGDPRANNSYLNPFWCSNGMYNKENPCYNEIDTNIPWIIWDYNYYLANTATINGLMRTYESNGDLSIFHNYIRDGYAVMSNQYVAPNPLDGTKQYDMYCDVYTGSWNPGTGEVSNETYVESRYVQIWVAPRTLTDPETPYVSLYKAPVGHDLRANFYVKGDIRQYRYSVNGGETWTTVTKESAEELTLPFEYMYYKLTNENRGIYTYDNNHGGNMLLYENEEDAREGNPWKAIDYKDKNQYYPTINDTGTPEIATTMGTTGLSSIFSKKYVLDKTDLASIANELFSSNGMAEDLIKGLSMMGERPIDAVQGLMYYPIDLSSFFNLVTSGSVFIGGYEITGADGYLLTNYNGYFEVGSINIMESFPNGDYRNYEPYCNLNIFLPFIGLESLKMNKYVGKVMTIRYYIDATNGECMACLFADGLLTDYFTGQMGVNLPITLNDYASYSSAQLGALVNIATSGATAAITAPINPIASSGTLADVEKSIFGLSQNSINNYKTSKGTSSSLMNHFLPNYVYVIFEIVETDETGNLSVLEGRRTNASGNVGSFSGFLQVESVNLTCSGATDNEKARVEQLLASGIYI